MIAVSVEEIFRMRKLFWLAVVIALAAWIAMLQRRLQAARMRGDMYRDISTRLDQRVVELTQPGQ
jgi:uncharacterized membrane protein YhaH (DUF805 family)